MRKDRTPADFLKSRYVRILSAVLIAQAALFYSISHGENIPLLRPLSDFPTQIKDWKMAQEGFTDKETQAVLRADDTLTRWYVNQKDKISATLFVAYFK